MESNMKLSMDQEEYEEKSLVEKFFIRTKQKPFLMAGIASLIVVCGIGAYKFKDRGNVSMSFYILRLRVLAQGAAIGCLTVGMCYKMLNDHVFKTSKKD